MATTSMDDILSDKPAKAETREKPEKPAPAERQESKAEAPDKPERAEREETERAKSRRKEHQRREWEAQGRDPETGQFVAKEKSAEKAEEKPEAKAEPKKDEKPAEAKTEAKPEAKPEQKPVEEMTPKEKAAFAAAADERRKRQALEQEIAKLRGAQPQQPAQKPEDKKVFWDDPDGRLAEHERKTQQLAVQMRLQTAEMIARSRHPDFDEKLTRFAELVKQNPGLGGQWITSQDPGEFAYRTAKNIMDIEQAGGVDKLLEDRVSKARAEERAKVEAEFKAKQEEAERKRAELPGSLSDVRGAATRASGPVFNGPTPMTDILKH